MTEARSHIEISACLGKSIALALGFDPGAVMQAIQKSCREELENGLTRAQVRDDLLGAWERWLGIRRSFPGIGPAEFFRDHWRDISVLEQSAALKSKPSEPREAAPQFVQHSQPSVQASQPRPRRRFYQPPPRPDMSVGRYDPDTPPVTYTAAEIEFMKLGCRTPEEEIFVMSLVPREKIH
jgi:hypothetical protein